MDRRCCAAWGLLLAGMAGCGPVADVALLSLQGVSPAVVEPGAELTVRGAGFAAGKPCQVMLRGTVRRPGARPRSVALDLPARADTEERVSVALGPQAFAELGEHGTFDGQLTLAFDAPAGGRVLGRTPLTLDLVQPMAHGAAHREALRKAARSLLDFLGLALAEDAATGDGLVIAWAAADSPAARAGLSQGDVIVRSAGVGLHSLSDFAPPPGLGSLALDVAHSDGSRRTHRVPLDGYDGPGFDRSLMRTSALGVAFLLCLAFLSPLPSPAHFLVRCRSRLRFAPPPTHGLWGGRHGTPRQRRLARASALCVSLWGALLVHAHLHAWLNLDRVAPYLLALTSASVLRGALAVPAQARLRVTGRACASLLGIAVVVSCACALLQASSLSGLVQAQGPWPHVWAIFQQPALLVGFALFAICGARLDHGGAGASPIESVLIHVALASLGATVFFGGYAWPASWQPPHVPASLLAGGLFVLKAWGVGLVLYLARRMALGAALHALSVLALAAAVIVISAFWLWLPPAPAIALSIGATLSLTSVLTLAIAAWSALRAARPMGETGL